LGLEIAEPRSCYARSIKKISPAKFATDISSLLQKYSAKDDVDTMVDTLESSLQSTIDDHAPLRRIKVKGDSIKPWYNDDIHSERQKRRRLERKARKTGLEIDRQLYLEQSQNVVEAIKLRKADYFHSKLENADCKETFKLLDGLIKDKNAVHLPQSASDKELVRKFSDYFHQKILDIRGDLDIGRHSTTPDILTTEDCSCTLDQFSQLSTEDLDKIIASAANKSCGLDIVPTSLLKLNRCILEAILPSLTGIVNASLLSGVFPSCFKRALVRPHLKKSGLDVNDLKNYRPVSNTKFLSKIIEKAVAQQITKHLDDCNLSDPLQSAYRKGASTETALIRIKADMDNILDAGDGILLVLLDLSAAFDTIDHQILLQRLEAEIGLSGTALNWMRSYITGRTQAVVINDSTSEDKCLKMGVPQGSVLGPLLFLIYILPLRRIIQRHNVNRHGFADDTQLYCRLSLRNSELRSSQVRIMNECIEDIRTWMLDNKLKMNDSKTEVLTITPSKVRNNLDDVSITVGDQEVRPSTTVRNLGAIFDSRLKMDKQVNTVVKRMYYNIRRIAKIKKNLTSQACKKAVNATVLSHLDFHNGLLLGTTEKDLGKLQLAQNNAARLLTGAAYNQHITPVLQQLHWLPVRLRINFKILVTIQKRIHLELSPNYLREITPLYKPARSLRSAQDSTIITVPRSHNRYGDRSFNVLGASLWNNLPKELRSPMSPHLFRKKLKTYFFIHHFEKN
jgi:hypothetical protein